MELLKNSVVDVKDIHVVKTFILTNNNNSQRLVDWYFLANRVNENYYEFFSGGKLHKADTNNNILSYLAIPNQTYNTPYISDVENLNKYFPNSKEIDIKSLFEFVTMLNVKNSIRAL